MAYVKGAAWEGRRRSPREIILSVHIRIGAKRMLRLTVGKPIFHAFSDLFR